MTEKKELENDFIKNLEKYLKDGDIDAKEDFMYAANLLVGKRYYKPMSVKALYQQITGKEIG